jgi:1,4-dihydroxy-2-naphthoate polyprenyltransferase
MAQPASPAPMSRRRAWWLATRPFSFPASIVPVLVGTAVAADEAFRPGLFLLAFAGSVLIHAGTNLATDFFDFTHGVQPAATLGGGSLQTGLLSARDVHKAAIACFMAGSALGLVLVVLTGWPVLAAGLASVLAGYFYTAAPISYGRRGLGEIGVFFFMGTVMVLGAYYVQVERLSWQAFYASLPVSILVANILHANNLRDIVNDRARHKVTIASIVDRPASDYVLYGLTVSAFAVVVLCVVLGALPVGTLLTLLAIPTARSMFRELRYRDAAALNPLVRGSARLHMHFGLLLAVGCLSDLVI